jgi:hypothetical protein
MRAIYKVQSAIRRSDKVASVISAACIAMGGLLTVAWTGVLGLYTYNVISWLFQ